MLVWEFKHYLHYIIIVLVTLFIIIICKVFITTCCVMLSFHSLHVMAPHHATLVVNLY